jgi:hypothetical protein
VGERPRLSPAGVLDQAVFALEVAARSTTPDAALNATLRALDEFDVEDVRRVLACLAMAAVRAMSPAEVQRWLDRLRLEHLMILESRDGPGNHAG